LKSGAKLTYSTRTKGGARGFSAPTVIFDEAQELTGEQYAAIVPVTSSFKNRQLIYTGTVLAGASVFRGLLSVVGSGSGRGSGSRSGRRRRTASRMTRLAIRQANPAIGFRPGLTVDYFLEDLERWRAAGEENRYREERCRSGRMRDGRADGVRGGVGGLLVGLAAGSGSAGGVHRCRVECGWRVVGGGCRVRSMRIGRSWRWRGMSRARIG
jgi:hypothetical protein